VHSLDFRYMLTDIWHLAKPPTRCVISAVKGCRVVNRQMHHSRRLSGC